jgi:hypothetical protein
MAFMQKQVTNKMKWFQVETSQRTEFIQSDIFASETTIESVSDLIDYCDGVPVSFEVIEGFGARLSAPGYMDCTEWTVFETAQEAQKYLDEMYPEDEEEADQIS